MKSLVETSGNLCVCLEVFEKQAMSDFFEHCGVAVFAIMGVLAAESKCVDLFEEGNNILHITSTHFEKSPTSSRSFYGSAAVPLSLFANGTGIAASRSRS
jgi:hypothetical protein